MSVDIIFVRIKCVIKDQMCQAIYTGKRLFM